MHKGVVSWFWLSVDSSYKEPTLSLWYSFIEHMYPEYKTGRMSWTIAALRKSVSSDLLYSPLDILH
jgi:hypothetical protein